MNVKVDKAAVQLRIRDQIGFFLDKLLGEDLYLHSFMSSDDAWTFRYYYTSTAAFPDETILSGHVIAKVKKKYAHLILEQNHRHRFEFCARVRGIHDIDVVLNRTDEE